MFSAVLRILFIKMPLLMPISAVMVTDGVLDTTHSVFSKVLLLDLTTPRGRANGLRVYCVPARPLAAENQLTLNT